MTITSIEVAVVNYPLHGEFKFFTTAPGQPPGRVTALVKVTTSDGFIGWGQSVPSPRWSYETIDSVTSTLKNYLAPELIGCDPTAIEELNARMDRVIAGGFSRGQPIAKAGVDLALWDLRGKIERRRLHELWKRPTRAAVALSWTLDPSSIDHLAEQVNLGHARGYRSFNLKLGRGLDTDINLIRHLRSLAPNDHLWVDANGGLDLDTALAIAPRLADLGVAAIEQPVPGNRISWYQRLKRQRALPILLDETIVGATELQEFIALGMLDGVVLKVARSGGLTESLKIAEVAEQAGLMIYGSGLTDPDISLAASLQLFAACDLKFAAALNGPQFITETFLREPIVVCDGEAMVPTGFGLGVEFSE